MLRKRLFLINSITVLLISITIIGVLKAQKTDTLSLVAEFNKKKEFNKSCHLLKDYFDHHQNELYPGWLYAESLHMINEYEKSSIIYLYLVKLFPKKYNLRLDFANKLIALSLLDDALHQLNIMSDKIPKDYLFIKRKTLTKIFFWKGDYKNAITQVELALSIYNDDPETIQLKKDIHTATSNWLQLETSYFNDDQPLEKITPQLIMGYYINPRLSTKISFQSPIYSTKDKMNYSQMLNGTVLYSLLNSKIVFELSTGIIKFPINEYDWSGSFAINKQFMKYFSITGSLSRNPYLATEAAIEKKIMQQSYGLSLHLNTPTSWLGEASYNFYQFPTIDNSYFTSSAWIVTPALSFTKLSFRIGYGFNYSDSENSNFVSKETFEEIDITIETPVAIDGIYDPFYSPNKQMVHSAIGMIIMHPLKNIMIGLNANFGVKAITNTPYLILEKDDAGKLYTTRQFYEDQYFPLQFDSYINYKFSSGHNIKVYYTYQKTNYYTSQLAGITLKLFL